MRPPPTLCVDFDNTICQSKYPEVGPPVKGAKEALTAFRALGFWVIISSCRTSHFHYNVYGGDPGQPTLERDHVKAMVNWLDEQGIPYDEIDDGSRGKVSALIYFDDRGFRVQDNWNHIMKYVMENVARIKES